MKIVDEQPNEVIGLEGGETFSIKTTAKAFQILSSGLYSDKITAIIRELSCNAYDSHVAAGNKEKPFFIRLPDEIESIFMVRDYGTGLSETDIKTIYTTYFESTKTNSNDFIGALGLGSKTPFSYTESFNIVSYFEGEQKSYIAFIDANGTPNVNKVSEKPTEEPNGLEISFYVNEEDSSEFKLKARNVLQYFEVLPDSNIALWNDTLVRKSDSYSLPKVVDRWGTKILYAIQGNICYPIAPERVPLCDFSNLRNNVYMHFDIGDLDVSASRESLSYDDRTVTNILKKFDSIIEEIKGEETALIENSKTVQDAISAYVEIRANSLYKDISIEYGNLIMEGDSSFRLKNNPDKDFFEKSKQVKLTYNKTLKNEKFFGRTSLNVLSRVCFLFDDVGRKTFTSPVFKEYLVNNSNLIGIFVYKGSKENVKYYEDALGVKIQMVSEFLVQNKIKISRERSMSSIRGSHFRNINDVRSIESKFAIYIPTFRSHCSLKDDNGNEIYENKDSMASNIHSLVRSKIFKTDEIYFVTEAETKKKMFKTLEKEGFLVNFNDYVKTINFERVKDSADDIIFKREFNSYSYPTKMLKCVALSLKHFKGINELEELAKQSRKKVISRNRFKSNRYKSGEYSKEVAFDFLQKIKFGTSYKKTGTDILIDEICEKFPLLESISFSGSNIKDVMEYIELKTLTF